MSVAAIVPIRSFEGGKNRLASALDPATRGRLAEGMANRTVSAITGASMRPVVVTVNDQVLAWARNRGLTVVPETGAGLNGAAVDGTTWAIGEGLAWVVIHSDLPLVTPIDLAPLNEALRSGRDVLAPSADGGTTAIGAASLIEFSYGPASASRHIGQLVEPAIFTPVGLLHDLDSVSDLESALSHQKGRWIANIVDIALNAGT